ncbi:hypothetical protein KFK09_027621 [Dendrobium nobile]|uniref:Uncharacterized protein n=1 Tax=Dendrobium nobile TaxID=94219 RepID=A0A8T3ABB2_DENNO|nr:hypothetical protein KFK09_027621 [Dendrobium nobile]
MARAIFEFGGPASEPKKIPADPKFLFNLQIKITVFHFRHHSLAYTKIWFGNYSSSSKFEAPRIIKFEAPRFSGNYLSSSKFKAFEKKQCLRLVPLLIISVSPSFL